MNQTRWGSGVKCLPYRYEDLSSDSQHPCKARHSSVGLHHYRCQGEDRDRCILGTHWSTIVDEWVMSRFIEGLCLKKTKVESDGGRHLMLTSALHTLMHIHVHTHIHTHTSFFPLNTKLREVKSKKEQQNSQPRVLVPELSL